VTTIVWDGTTLFTDSLVTDDGMRFGTEGKALRLDDGSILAVAGCSWMLDALADHIENGADQPKLGDDDGFTAILVKPSGEAFEYCKTEANDVKRHRACVPWAGGSGGRYAMTALHLGLSGAEAVRVACELDVGSGEPIVEYKPK
jgi:hypothetical protein